MKVKNLFPIVAILLVAAPAAFAQPTAQGNFVIGSRFGFSTSTSNVEVSGDGNNFSGEGARATQFAVSPSIGFFFTNNFAFGIGMDYFSSRTQEGENSTDPTNPRDETIDSDLLFGPFARIYLPWAEDKALFLGVSTGFGHAEDQFETGSGNSEVIRNNIFTVGAGLGFTIFANNGLALESLVKYNWARSQNRVTLDNVERRTKSLTNAIDLSVGLQYYFAR